ncbi:MAG: hypothetical protein RIE77_14125 [Phycisphaerales bacterium]|jgi:tetratricopeptide (TPR) repeat protein
MARTALTFALALATAAALFLIGGSTSNGCLWDRDTLRAEAAGAPGMVETIVGRFDRFPPLYYEMRLERAAADVAADPTDLAAYDDAGVACDRLGRYDEAIAWMARKRAALDVAPESGTKTDHEYRYLANLGTFHVHRWLATGADRSNMADVERARDLIDQAITLNPDAHFGRERYQLMAIDWILEPPSRYEFDTSHVSILEIDPDLNAYEGRFPLHRLTDKGYDDAAEGFAGLVSLGNGWNSFDIFFTLGGALQGLGESSLGALAWLRAEEIARDGGRSLHPDAQAESFEALDAAHTNLSNTDPVEAFYEEARAEADAWHAARTAYITTRLKQGQHPDTHPAFFAAWVEPSTMPAMPDGLFGLGGFDEATVRVGLVVGGLVLLMMACTLTLLIRLVRRQTVRRDARGPAPAA